MRWLASAYMLTPLRTAGGLEPGTAAHQRVLWKFHRRPRQGQARAANQVQPVLLSNQLLAPPPPGLLRGICQEPRSPRRLGCLDVGLPVPERHLCNIPQACMQARSACPDFSWPLLVHCNIPTGVSCRCSNGVLRLIRRIHPPLAQRIRARSGGHSGLGYALFQTL